MKLEPIIQSEESQKENHQYSIQTHIYIEFRKMVTMTLYVRQQKRHRYKEYILRIYCGSISTGPTQALLLALVQTDGESRGEQLHLGNKH